MRPYRGRTGWVKETVNAEFNRGEANCTADLIEAACYFGMAGHPSYLEDAERMLRNHLLASQMDEMSWVTENEDTAHTATRAHDRLRWRARGGFCFAVPNGYHSYNTDLTGAALQGIAAAWRHVITRDSDNSVRINLCFSRSDDDLEVTSMLPAEGRVVVEAKRPVSVAMRIPPWCPRPSLAATVAGVPLEIPPGNDYLNLGELAAGAMAEVTFEQPEFLTDERYSGRPYRIRWRGNTVIGMSDGGEPMALYPDVDL